MDGPFAGRHQALAQRASANPTTGAAANMALALWNYKYYTTMDTVCIETYFMSATAQGVEFKQRVQAPKQGIRFALR
ncbi:unnamed protein product [marine sediment metagenome]|uniref:Uncharacterized protein n=1 Tax=marine sediment metagenome TaxID=412755 RepID=X1LJY9_9ZZZZ